MKGTGVLKTRNGEMTICLNSALISLNSGSVSLNGLA